MSKAFPLPERQTGFTLIELMIVVSIIAILATILIPTYFHARAEAMSASCEANEKQIATALEEYAVDHAGSYPAPGPITNTSIGILYLDSTPTDPVSQLGYSFSTGGSGYGSYQITDSGGHDPSTTNNLPGNPGGNSIIYNQNTGIRAK